MTTTAVDGSGSAARQPQHQAEAAERESWPPLEGLFEPRFVQQVTP
jgi:hypothetical protein